MDGIGGIIGVTHIIQNHYIVGTMARLTIVDIT